MRRMTVACLTVAMAFLMVLAACAPPPSGRRVTTPTTTPTPTVPSAPATTTQVFTAAIRPFNHSRVAGLAVVTVQRTSTSTATTESVTTSESSGATESEGASETSPGGSVGTTGSTSASGSTGATGSTMTSGSTGATGTVKIRIVLVAAGLTRNQRHALAINGFTGGKASVMPPAPKDGTVITESMAEASYGPVIMPLQPYPVASNNGVIRYSQTFTAPAALSANIAGRAIVIHGMTVRGRYSSAVPVAIGILKGPISRGMMGTTETPGGTTSPMPGGTTNETTGEGTTNETTGGGTSNQMMPGGAPGGMSP